MKTKIVIQLNNDMYGKEVDMPMITPSETLFIDRFKIGAVYIDTLYKGEMVQTIICISEKNISDTDLLYIGYEEWNGPLQE